MDVEVNWVGVVLGALSTMVVGSIWYAKPVFGNTWAKLVGLSEKDMEKGSTKALGLTLLISFVTAYVVAHVAFLSNRYFGNSFFQDSVTTAFWLWLGLTAGRMITHDLFEQRPSRLTLMNAGNEFATLMVMGIVIGLFQP